MLKNKQDLGQNVYVHVCVLVQHILLAIWPNRRVASVCIVAW